MDDADDEDMVIIEDRIYIAPRVTIVTATHPLHADERLSTDALRGKVVIKKAWIGTGAIILPNVTVGEGAVVGAGAVVSCNRRCASLYSCCRCSTKQIKKLNEGGENTESGK